MHFKWHCTISVTNVRADGLFEGGVLQEIGNHLIILVNNAVFQMQ